MTQPTSQGAGNPSDERELDPSELTDEELRSYFTGDAVSEETPESDETQTETQEETEVGNTTEETSEDAETDTEQDRLAKMRVRPKDDVDQQILDLYKSEGFHGTLAEASQVIKGSADAASPTQAEPQAQTQADSPESQLNQILSDIKELQAKARAASEELDTAQAFELQNEIMEKKVAHLKIEQRLERDKEREQANFQETYRQKAVESRDKVFQRFPVLQDTKSTARKQFDAFVAEKQNDPDYASVFESPKWVELMANEFSTTVDISPPSGGVTVDNLNRPPKTNTKVLTSASNTSTVSKQPKITPQGIRDSMDRLDRATLYSMLGQE
jgi:hypothetical protein